MENPIKMEDLGVPSFTEKPIFVFEDPTCQANATKAAARYPLAPLDSLGDQWGSFPQSFGGNNHIKKHMKLPPTYK